MLFVQAKGDLKEDKASAESTASHSVGKVGPFAATPEGGVSKDNPDRTSGAWNQNVGAAKEAVGGFLGADGMKREGQQQNAEGKAQEASGQVSDFGSGMGDRIQGALGGALAGASGDRAAQKKYQEMHYAGTAQQRSDEADIQKQA